MNQFRTIGSGLTRKLEKSFECHFIDMPIFFGFESMAENISRFKEERDRVIAMPESEVTKAHIQMLDNAIAEMEAGRIPF